MKRFFKLFFIIVLFLYFGFSMISEKVTSAPPISVTPATCGTPEPDPTYKVPTAVSGPFPSPSPVPSLGVEYERSEEMIEDTPDCPQPGDPNLISICGIVKNGAPATRTISDGSNVVEAQRGVEGVSVYLYEADNTAFGSGKINGELVNLFSSTSTNKEGKFHLVARQTDNKTDMQIHTKLRFLVFTCGGLSYIQELPSYVDLTEIRQEVSCAKNLNIPFKYTMPPARFSYIQDVKTASHVGTDDEANYPSGYEKVSEFYYSDDVVPAVNQSVDLKLEDADWRFSIVDEKKTAVFDKSNLPYPEEGAFWSLDCFTKYVEYDKENKGEEWWKLCAVKDVATMTNPDSQKQGIQTEDIAPNGVFEKKFYTLSDFLIQVQLPNIPHRSDLLYFKPLEVSSDVVAFASDEDAVARWISLHYSNIGQEFSSRWFGSNESRPYLDCEEFKKSNNPIGTKDEIVNTGLVTGYSKALNSPVEYKNLMVEMNPDTPICLLNGEDGNIIFYKDIQPPHPYSYSCEGYKLCSEYWNYDMILLYKPEFNTTGNIAQAAQVEENDSYWAQTSTEVHEGKTKSYICDNSLFGAGRDALGASIVSCAETMYPSQEKSPQPLMAMHAISSGYGSEENTSVEQLTNVFVEPFRDEEDLMYLIRGGSNMVTFHRANDEVFQKALYSSANDENVPVSNIVSATQDNEKWRNETMAEEGANKNHYPLSDLENGVISLESDKGARTRHTSTFTTTAAWNRTLALQESASTNFFEWLRNLVGGGLDPLKVDALDSITMAVSGMGYVDWAKANSLMGDLTDGFFTMLALYLTDKENKSFLDRENTPSGPYASVPTRIDSLTTKGFDITEANFKEKFPLPSVATGLNIGDWSNGQEYDCYPWKRVPLGEWDSKLGRFDPICNTYKREPKASDGSTNTGYNEESGGVSRTCRVDLCMTTYAPVEATCERKLQENPTTGLEEYVYEVVDIIRVYPIVVRGPDVVECEDVKSRLKCAQEQVTCYDPLCGDDKMNTCIKKLYEDDLEEEKLKETLECGSGDFSASQGTDTVTIRRKVPTPSCTMSAAGPNTCDGDIRQEATVEISQQTVELPESAEATYNNTENNLDATLEADRVLETFFTSPVSRPVNNRALSITSIDVSIRDFGMPEDNNKNKSSRHMPVGDGGTGTFIRSSVFAPPVTFSIYNNTYEPLYIHCSNSTLGTSGSWECEFVPVPNPPASPT